MYVFYLSSLQPVHSVLLIWGNDFIVNKNVLQTIGSISGFPILSSWSFVLFMHQSHCFHYKDFLMSFDISLGYSFSALFLKNLLCLSVLLSKFVINLSAFEINWTVFQKSIMVSLQVRLWIHFWRSIQPNFQRDWMCDIYRSTRTDKDSPKVFGRRKRKKMERETAMVGAGWGLMSLIFNTSGCVWEAC